MYQHSTEVEMAARFAGKCSHCAQPIATGEPIVWLRGQFTRHARCHRAAQSGAPAVQPELPVTERPRVALEDAGVYVLPDGTICKVQVYEPGLVEQVAREGRKMTLEEAKAFIVLYGRCARCGRALKAAESVERGIGPICYKWFAEGTTGATLLIGAAASVHTHAH
jgi:bacterioferritin-associated ferredoxin